MRLVRPEQFGRPSPLLQAMQVIDTNDMAGFFSVLAGTERSQAASMVLGPDQSTGGPQNAHPRSDQWLYVIDGTGTATVDGDEYELTPGVLVCIEAGETHEITAGADAALETINVYAPPEY